MGPSAAIRKLVADAEALGYTAKAGQRQYLTLSLNGPRPTTFAVHFDDGQHFSAGYRYQGHGGACMAMYRTLRALRADIAEVAERRR